ncbi:tyrosine--tRNA ligase [Patescibacteria group bacterium]|nr:tyrosine--tRNA ligase [Patescibacteria group bacterium]MBU4162291.1 tyrosine--tRNA ligase [Patescibacteria group bacterium]
MKIDSKKIDEVLTRSVEQIVDRDHFSKALASGKKLRIKHGIDPTGDKIHIGRAIQLWKLKAFQDLGHKIVLIIGDFTARIGDPSDKPEGRKGLKDEEIKKNVKSYSDQIGKILDLKKTEIRYNSEWFNKMPLGDFLHLSGNFSVQQLVQRRNFHERWKKGEPISLKEICYPLLQGYDSVAVKADIELGGYDQLFNLNAGRDIQRLFGMYPQDIMTLKMLSGLDGRKMSTSWGNVINIVDKPEDMYGKLMSMRDEMIFDYFELCTLLAEKELSEIKRELKNKNINPRDIKARLAREIVSMYHSEKLAQKAGQEFDKIFKEKRMPSKMPVFFTPKPSYPIVELLFHLGLASSKGEGKRLVLQGGVRVDSNVIKDFKQEIKVRDEMIIQVGKRKFAKLITHDIRC